MRNKVEEKKRLVSALTAGVSPEGQKLYLAITKTILDQVSYLVSRVEIGVNLLSLLSFR